MYVYALNFRFLYSFLQYIYVFTDEILCFVCVIFGRYKIFIEGIAWSVSDKYILGCDSMTLLVKPKYYDFFTRSLVEKKHYWPIRPSNLCRDIKSAVEWGNNNTDKVNYPRHANTNSYS
jgi:hypothetical protein